MLRTACVLLACAVSACGPNRGNGQSLAPELLWMLDISATEGARVNAVEIGDDDIVIAGEFSGTLTIGGAQASSAGARDGFVARLDKRSGATRWLRRFGGPGDDRARAISFAAPANATGESAIAFGGEIVGRVTVGDSTVIGAGQPDGLVGVLDKDGDFEWARAVGGTRFAAISGVAFLASGDVAAVGSFAGQTTLVGRTVYAAGGHDVLVARFRRAGGVVWASRAGGPGADIARAIIALPDGGALLAGSVMNGARFGAIDIEIEHRASNLLVANIDGDGQFRWATHAGGEQNDSAAALVLADDVPIAGGRAVPALVKASEAGALSSATALPDLVEVAALAFDRRLFAARVVANPIGVGGGVAITAGLLEGRTQTVNLASNGAVSATALDARDELVALVGSFKGDLVAGSAQLEAPTKQTIGFVAVFRWP